MKPINHSNPQNTGRDSMNKNPINSAVMRPKQAAAYCGFSVTSLWRLEQTDPDFPNKLRFSARCVGYRQADLDAYLQRKTEIAIEK